MSDKITNIFRPSDLDGIVFDMDDTLYPEYMYVLSGFQAVANWCQQHIGIPSDIGFPRLQELFESGVRGDTFNQWLTYFGISVKDQNRYIPELICVYREHQPLIEPFFEVLDVLPKLHRIYRLGLVSDGYLPVQQRKLSALNLEQHLDAIVFSDEFGRGAWKPSPKPFQVVLQRLGIEPSRSVYIGDNPLKDFFGAGQIGMYTIWLKHADGDYASRYPPSVEHEPNLIFNSWMELRHFFISDSMTSTSDCK